MKRLMLGLVLFSGFAFLALGCSNLKEGECKRDRHCEDKASKPGELWVCYKEPPESEIGKCLLAKDARVALAKYKKKKDGKCDDGDGDGVGVGDACEGPVDCNDKDKDIKPGGTEVCDAKDNDCDQVINEGLKSCVGTVLGGKRDPICHFMITMTSGVAVAPNGDVWVSDQHQIFRIDAKGKPSRFAGSNKPGHENKKGKFARFDEPVGLAVGPDGSVYVAECKNNCVRKVSTDGQVSTYAGHCSNEADNAGLDKLGDWDKARFWCPIDLTFDADGSLLVVDRFNAKIKRITKARKVELVAGVGGKDTDEGVVFGSANGPALKAEFDQPVSIAKTADGAFVIADMKNNCIRLLKGGKVSTLAGQCAKVDTEKENFADGKAAKAKFKMPNGVAVAPDGTVYVADTGNHCIRKIGGGKVTTAAGRCLQQGYFDGLVKDALFNQPLAIDVAKDGSLWIIDHGNYRVRHLIP